MKKINLALIITGLFLVAAIPAKIGKFNELFTGQLTINKFLLLEDEHEQTRAGLIYTKELSALSLASPDGKTTVSFTVSDEKVLITIKGPAGLRNVMLSEKN